MDKKEKFLMRIKSAQHVKQLSINDILDLAVKHGLGLREAFIEVKKALLNGDIHANALDTQVLNIFDATHLRRSPQSTEHLEFERRVAEEVKRIEAAFTTHLQTYQEQERRKEILKAERQAERSTQRSMSTELNALLNPKLKLKRG